MNCMFCEEPATVHLTDIVNKKKREAHLCDRCARERNLLPDPPGPQIDLKALLDLLMTPFQGQPEGGSVEREEEACPACGTTLAAFKAEGRLGCGQDYEAFRETLLPLLERVHRAIGHEGKVPTAARKVARVAELNKLRAQMTAAAAAEDYEQAARLRDLIRQKEAEGTPG